LKKSTVLAGIVVSTVILSMILAACGSGGTPTTSGTQPTQTTGQQPTQPVTTATSEKPQYGGTLTITGGDPLSWDQYYTVAINTNALGPTGNVLIEPDWMKGPAGSKETTWTRGAMGRYSLLTGGLATSWDMPDGQTIVYHLRKGVRFQNRPPVNGRELTADDVVWNLQRYNTAPSNTTKPEQKPTSFKATDKYTVEIKVPTAVQGSLLYGLGGSMAAATNYFWPHEVIDQYGDMKDWKHVIGTGPFILSDYVNGSSITYIRNPDFWAKDPLHPENQVPYIDKLQTLIITDTSTMLSALRTGKIDIQGLGRAQGVGWEDAALLMKQTKLEYIKKVADLIWLWGRLDKDNLPFKDINVRRAMNMAIDRDLLVKTYYGGTATAYTAPWPPTPDYAPIYTPLEEQPPEVQELFTYNPDKAKKLLTDAGYPSGFKTNVVCGTTSVDFLSLIREMLLKVNIDMEIKPLEPGAMQGVMAGRTHEQMIYSLFLLSTPTNMNWVRSELQDDRAMYENPYTREVYNKVQSLIGKDEAQINQLMKDVSKFILAEVIGIMLPQTYNYTMWWPWLKGYHGEGFEDAGFATRYMWIDQSVKKSMSP